MSNSNKIQQDEMIGKTFNMFTILKRVENSGGKKIIKGTLLRTNKILSFGKKIKCNECGVEFYVSPSNGNRQYYSQDCYNKNHRVEFICKYCEQKENIKKSDLDSNKKYCSTKCHVLTKTQKIKCRCKTCNATSFKSPSYLKEDRLNTYCSQECWRKSNDRSKGKNHWNWNDELTDKDRIIKRNYPEYIKFIKQVFERDDYICCSCESRHSDLVDHHKLLYYRYEDKRIDVSNGVTMCRRCHKEFHDIFGYKDCTKYEFGLWLITKIIKRGEKKVYE